MFTLFRTSRAIAALFALLAATPLAAQYHASMALDRSFGANGFAALPQLDPTQPGIAPIGFVRLPLSGGYVYFHVQQVGANTRVVATRFHDNGTINTGWGSNGSLIYTVPVPAGGSSGDPLEREARVAVGVESGAEVIYLAEKFVSGGTFLGVARFAADGTFVSFDSSNLPTYLTSAMSSITAITTHPNMFFGDGLLVAVQGSGADSTRTALVHVTDGTIDNATNASLVRPGLRVNHLIAHPDGRVDVVGTEAGFMLYVEYNADNDTWGTDRFFHFPCPSGGTATASAADGMVRPASFGSDVLIIGRAVCSGGPHAMVARVSAIGTSPSVSWAVATTSDLGGCTDLVDRCRVSFAAVSSAGANRAYATTPMATLAHIDIDSNPGRLLGTDQLGQGSPSSQILVAPTFALGADQVHPFLVGFGYVIDVSTVSSGLGRIAVDRIFADGHGF